MNFAFNIRIFWELWANYISKFRSSSCLRIYTKTSLKLFPWFFKNSVNSNYTLKNINIFENCFKVSVFMGILWKILYHQASCVFDVTPAHCLHLYASKAILVLITFCIDHAANSTSWRFFYGELDEASRGRVCAAGLAPKHRTICVHDHGPPSARRGAQGSCWESHVGSHPKYKAMPKEGSSNSIWRWTIVSLSGNMFWTPAELYLIRVGVVGWAADGAGSNLAPQQAHPARLPEDRHCSSSRAHTTQWSKLVIWARRCTWMH